MFSQDMIQSMPNDVHPVGALVTAMSALSIFYPDANPSLMVSYVFIILLSSENFHADMEIPIWCRA